MSFLAEYDRRSQARIAQANAEYALMLAAAQPKHVKPDYAKIISDWWDSMPPASRQHPWSLEVIAAAAFSKLTQPPALRKVAEALRAAGFTERRDWTRAGRNRRLWIPPTGKQR